MAALLSTGAWACASGAPPADLCLAGATERWSLPAAIPEASGLAVSRVHDGLVWTHNDGEEGLLYGLELPAGGGEARLAARVRVPGSFRDVEDLALAPCGGAWCLYLADTGDNSESRPSAAIVRVPEPGPGDSVVSEAGVRRTLVVFPDRARDVEALAVLPGERVHLLSKGRSGPPTWYRVPQGPEGEPRTLVPAGAVDDGRPGVPDQVTGAAALPGEDVRVVVRTYRSLEVHEVREAGASRLFGPVSIAYLGEPQGEAVAVAPDGALLLASEAGPFGGAGGIIRLRCGT